MANIISDEMIEYVGILAKLSLSGGKRSRPGRTWEICWIILTG